MQENQKRGQRVLAWMKAVWVSSIVMMVAMVALWEAYGGIFQQETLSTLPMGIGLLVLVGVLMLSALVILFASIVCGVFWMIWLYHAVENLRLKAPTTFSPWGAVLCPFIPVVGLIIHFFTMKNLVQVQERVLSEREVKFAPVSAKTMRAWLVLLLVSIVVTLCSHSMNASFLSMALGIVGLACYMNTMKFFVGQEQLLFELHEDERLRRKVDEVLREREIVKAANAVRDAHYEDEPPPPPDV